MMYILTKTAKRKNAKRHIILRTPDLACAMHVGADFTPHYIVEIYTGNWQPILYRNPVDGTWMQQDGGEE